MLTRRTFLESSAATALATRLFAAPAGSNQPNAELESLGAVALNEAKKQKATYCDIRIIRYRRQFVTVRLNPERGTGKTLEVPNVADTGSFGFGVRVIANGAWGFAASPIVTKEEIARITREAVTVARANSVLQSRPLVLAPVGSYHDRWQTPHEKDPFAVPLEQKLELIRSAAAEVKKGKGVFAAGCNLSFRSEDKYFASSEGSSIQQLNLQTYGQVNGTAVDTKRGLSRTRRYQPPQVTAGYEYIPIMNLVENAQRVREEVIEHLNAPAVTAGKKDLVLLPSHLWLTIHESLGHSTELDRALGYEANYAGTSFLTPDKLGKERIGSEIVNIWGDRTNDRGLATTAYDDDGVKTTKFPIIEKGVFKHYQTIRDQAALIGEKESRGCCYADSWSSVPFQRMPNVWLEPGKQGTSLDDLIGGVEDGILIDGDGSFSIDQQRYNFQFGGDAFWAIKGGKKQGMVSRVAYQSRTTDFWQSCDLIAGPSYWQQWGAANDGKGEPGQINSVSHGCSPARFRQINVIVTD
ncbi:TldD/PmbA family protein [uncultured Paludibaculum sp.]|uniref:TldD/PmbA family protein n=1 Tax=uncultured Paludibaculum sp. TaxID=1765020 RepID=UPI002AAC3E37|nr:TldD/PmbA family protein [uncultured Paludibaculum sp.]